MVVLAALMVSVFALLGGGKPTRAIVGGTEVKPADKYPFMVRWCMGGVLQQTRVVISFAVHPDRQRQRVDRRALHTATHR